MGKERFTINPFPDLKLSQDETARLEELSMGFIQEHLCQYEQLINEQGGKVDSRRWKLAKSREDVRVYAERPRQELERQSRKHSMGDDSDLVASELPVVLAFGSLVGNLEDVLFGVLNPTLNTMRVKASYVEDLSGAAVLASVVEPSLDDPFHSLVIKWMEIDIPLRSTNLVKNRDYVYMEATGFIKSSTGERLGYHFLHSVDFPEAELLPNRIRGKFSVCGFFRQLSSNCVEVWAMGTVDPGGDLMRFLLVPTAALALLSSTKYVYCAQMKKLSWLLEKQYAERASRGMPRREKACVTCGKTSMMLGASKCRLCYGFVCFSCKVSKKLSFVTPDNELMQRKVDFCSLCISQAIRTSSVDAARAQIRGSTAPSSLYRSASLSVTSSEQSYSDR